MAADLDMVSQELAAVTECLPASGTAFLIYNRLIAPGLDRDS